MNYWFSIIFASQRKRLWVGLFWAVFTALSSVALLALSGWLITSTAIAGIAVSLGVLFQLEMYLPGSGIRFFALSRTVGRYIERLYNHDTILRLIASYRVHLFQNVSSLSLSTIRRSSDSEWLSRLTSDLDALDSLLTRYFISTMTVGIVIVISTIILLIINEKFALVLGLFMISMWLGVTRLSVTLTKHASLQYSSTINTIRNELISHLRGATTLIPAKLMHNHQGSIEKQLKLLDEYQAYTSKQVTTIQFVLDVCLSLSFISLFVIGVYSMQLKILEGPTVVMFCLLFLGMSELLQTIPEQLSSWGKTSFSAKRLNVLVGLQQPKKQEIITGITSLTVEINNHPRISSSIDRPIHFNLTENEQLLITGRSGSGKSTIANSIIGVEPINTSSSMLINSISLPTISELSITKHIGYLQQKTEILSGSIYYNLTLGLKCIDENRINDVLSDLELLDWINSLPKGIHSWLGETGEALSGGQARRLSLARLLLRDYDLLVLDEPFSGLNYSMAERIFHNIKFHLESRKSIILLHEVPDFMRGPFKVIALHE